MAKEDRVHLDLIEIVKWAGYVGLFAIVFAETGLLFGFFLPGDSLLITAGVLATDKFPEHQLSLAVLIPLLIVAAIAGDATGYVIGRQMGPRLFVRDDARFFRRKHLIRAGEFYERHGGKTIVLARFLAIIRTFAPTVAGAAGMKWSTFTFYNVMGGVGWVVSMVLLGYFVGEAIPNLDAFFFGILAVVIGVSLAPAAIHLWRERAATRRTG
ncbi:MAG: VTT domain-containing protein [Dehalococcoidia bacterium]